MNNRPPLHWVVSIGFLLLLGPLLILWWITPKPVAPIPIERFLPGKLSAALCLRRPYEAWQRHWTTRQGPAPEAALQAIFEALEKWPRWTKKYGEMQSKLRLKLYQEAFFQTVGEEAWLVFGEWGGSRPGAGQVGLVAFIRADSPVTSRVRPLMDLIFGNYKVRRASCEGEPVYEYLDKKMGRSLTVCQIGGWICVSLRRRDAGPLPAIIRQVNSGDGATTQTRRLELMPELTSATQALACGLRPNVFWGQLRQFTMERGRKFSKLSEQRFKFWQQQLDGIDHVTLAQSGDSLLDFQLDAEGQRPAMLSRLMREEMKASSVTLAGAPMIPAPSEAATTQSLAAGSDELAQIEMALPFARMSVPLAGNPWEQTLKSMKWLDAFLPGLRGRLDEALVNGDPQAKGRIGLAAYVSPLLIPRLLFWIDRPPEVSAKHAPARVWSAAPLSNNRSTTADCCLWLAAPNANSIPAGIAKQGGAWSDFTDGLWAGRAEPPLAFVSLNFRVLAGEMEKIPALLMKKKERKKIQRWRAAAQALALGAGGAAMRLDPQGDHWILTCRTP